MKFALILLFTGISLKLFSQSAWQEIETDLNKPIQHIFFLNEDIGWAYSSVYNASTYNHDKTVHKTINGGKNWTAFIQPQSIEWFTGFYFVTEYIGWATSGSGIYKTLDGGISWNMQYEDDYLSIREMNFTDTLKGWLLIRKEYIDDGSTFLLQTKDGGNTWTKTTIETSSRDIVDAFFINDTIGYSCYQGIFKTSNGGTTWTRIVDPLSYGDFHCIQFVNDSVGWSAGHAIYKTVDGGETWQFQKQLGTFTGGNAAGTCHFFNEAKGLIDRNYITYDGGENWEECSSEMWPEESSIVSFVNEDVWYAYPTGSEINTFYMTTCGGVTSAKYPQNQLDEVNFRINPNPLSGRAIIQYTLLKSEYVSLKIYNLTGQYVTTLFEGVLSAGKHQVQWQPDGSPGGIYLARLEVGVKSKTMKLILQK